MVYPRPRGRGPIEASLTLAPARGAFRYPRPRGRGPIEASLTLAPARGAFRYPRPRGRGPIEARMRGQWLRQSALTIRDLAVAAPLKRGISL